MADSAASSGLDAPASETPTQRQARLRREKRQQKLAQEGEDRLNRIKALNGGVAPPPEVLGGPAVPDPDEVDISHHTAPSPGLDGSPVDTTAQPRAQPDSLAAAMRQMQQEQARNRAQMAAEGNQEDDPMVRMMQQVMGVMGAGGPQQPGGPQPDLPPLLGALLGGGGATPHPQSQQASDVPEGAYIWRIVHAIFAFALAGWAAWAATFDGTALARRSGVDANGGGRAAGWTSASGLFMLFVSVELGLQSTRYFVEKGRLRGGGILATVANSGFVPEPWAGYVRIVGRYAAIAQTMVADVMAMVFTLGALAWWRGIHVA